MSVRSYYSVTLFCTSLTTDYTEHFFRLVYILTLIIRRIKLESLYLHHRASILLHSDVFYFSNFCLKVYGISINI